MDTTTTIAALATSPAPAGLAVIRVSGPQSETALRALFRAKRSPVDHPREMVFGHLLDYKTGTDIDHALAVYMPGPHSYTGEDVAEFQFHGSPLLVQKMLRSLFAFGALPAEPGEFTKRAFLNGKLDLIQAEAIADLIHATSEQSLKIAGEHLKGRFSGAVAQIGEPLRDVLAEIESSIDFPDEGVPSANMEHALSVTTQAKAAIELLLRTYSFGQVVRDGFRVLLCGRPNVGKSSLLNIFLGHSRAIVTEIPGTTRDLIEESVTIAGFKFVFCDSAGISKSEDKIEQIGVELAKERVPWADVILFVVDGADTEGAYHEVLDYLRGKARKIWMVVNKIDLNPKAFSTFFCDSDTCAQNFYLSATTGDGVPPLLAALVDEVKSRIVDNAQSSQVVTNERQRTCLIRSREALDRVEGAMQQRLPPEIVCAELRSSLNALEEVVGKTYNEDILGRIFSKFCIGK